MKNQVLTYFMWGYQTHFRAEMERYSRQAFAALGASIELNALLVGVRLPDVANDL